MTIEEKFIQQVEVTELDFEVEVPLDDYEETVSAAEEADLPQGFGRD